MSETVLITGASRGIGRTIALYFAKAGYNIVINYNNSEDKAVSIYNEIASLGVSVIMCHADVSSESQVKDMQNTISNHYGGVDILINNAGISEQALISDITVDMWDRMFNINIKSIFLCSKAFLPYMINRKYGRIINISSIWGVVGASCETHYSASKAAVIGFTKSLAKETGPSGISVNCIAPGVIDTDMNSLIDEQTMAELKNATPVNRIGKPEDVAEAALFLASARSGFITGQVICVDGGFILN